MKIFDTEILDIKIIKPTVYEDERGYFFEAYNAHEFEELMGFYPSFCQSNESFSKKGTIRGLHLQKEPYAQSKLVRVISGAVLDVAVDCRVGSQSFGKYVAVELSSKNNLQLWIPKGFAHGFQVLSETCLLNYQVDTPYNSTAEVSVNAFDTFINIKWHPSDELIMKESDRNAENFFDVIAKESIKVY
jgi:dTDP-4-dehydrorhamnose 3,5-epimerase